MKKYITAAALLAAGTAFANAAADASALTTLSMNVQEGASAETSGIATYGFSASLTSDWLKGWSDEYNGLKLSSVSLNVTANSNTALRLTVAEWDGDVHPFNELNYVAMSDELTGITTSMKTLTFSFSDITLSADKDYVFIFVADQDNRDAYVSNGSVHGGNFKTLTMEAYSNANVGTTDTATGFIQNGTGGYNFCAKSEMKASISISGTAIPEPSAFGLLAGAGALALVASRRRRRAK